MGRPRKNKAAVPAQPREAIKATNGLLEELNQLQNICMIFEQMDEAAKRRTMDFFVSKYDRYLLTRS